MAARLGGAWAPDRSRRQSVDIGFACGQPFQLEAALVLEVVEAVDDEAAPGAPEDEEDDDEDDFAAVDLSSVEDALPFDSAEPFAAARLSVR